MAKQRNIFVAGHRGMVGRALCRRLKDEPGIQLFTVERSEIDLTNQPAVLAFLNKHRIDEVILAAAKVGGIYANNEYPAEFIYENLCIESSVINASHRADVDKLLFLGSSCIYPKFAAQPITESSLLSGQLEPTNEPYAIAKIAGIKLCESYNRQYGRDYRSVMPTNLYGPYDNFDPFTSHVIPALLGKFERAAIEGGAVEIWGSGSARREFMHVDDLADACCHLLAMQKETFWRGLDPMCSHLNIGTGKDCSIAELATLIKEITQFSGELVFDKSKPDGTPVKRLDVSKLADRGWQATISLEAGLKHTWQWMCKTK